MLEKFRNRHVFGKVEGRVQIRFWEIRISGKDKGILLMNRALDLKASSISSPLIEMWIPEGTQKVSL
jgi:hypothetical protein